MVSIRPGEIELARIPYSRPSIASCRANADDSGLGRGVGKGAQRLEAHQAVQGRRVHDYAVAGLQMRPTRAGEVKNKVDLFPKIAVPLLVRNVFEPVEVRHRGVVE